MFLLVTMVDSLFQSMSIYVSSLDGLSIKLLAILDDAICLVLPQKDEYEVSCYNLCVVSKPYNLRLGQDHMQS